MWFAECGSKMEKGCRMRLQNFIPLVVILLFWLLSLLVRFVFQLDGIGLSVFEAINEIVKVVLSIGIAWLILKNVSVPISKEKFPKIEVIVGVLSVGALLALYYFVWIGAIYDVYTILCLDLLILVGVPIMFSIRHYGWKDLRLFIKDLGLSIPTIRTIASLVVTLLVLFTLIVINAGNNLPIFLQDYVNTTGLINWLYIRLIVLAFLPEELFFRVYLQTRLEKLMPIGWAILIQAFLFGLVHIPMNAIGLGWGWGFLPHFAGQTLVINGLIGGYLWYKTRNLPVLVLYHWTIYPLLPLIFFPSWIPYL